MAQNRQDMGSGPVKPLLLQLMIPAVVAQVVNLLYNIVDRIYIGHIEGIGAAAYFSVFVGWPWPHFFTGDQCAKIDLHGETGNCHLLLQMPVFRFVQTEKNRDRSFSDNRFLLEIGWGLRGLAPLTSAFG